MSTDDLITDGRYRQCPSCPRMMLNSSRKCSACIGVGRPGSTDVAYAMEIGITVRRLRQMGGETRFRSMNPDCRACSRATWVMTPPDPYDYVCRAREERAEHLAKIAAARKEEEKP